MSVKIYCTSCDENHSVDIEPLQTDELNGATIWGDIVCTECKLVIATLSADESGIYALVKVGELPPRAWSEADSIETGLGRKSSLWTINNSQILHFDSTGNVGLNYCRDPQSLLHIHGDVDHSLRIDQSDPESCMIRFADGNELGNDA